VQVRDATTAAPQFGSDVASLFLGLAKSRVIVCGMDIQRIPNASAAQQV
jgi:hypothetical protein